MVELRSCITTKSRRGCACPPASPLRTDCIPLQEHLASVTKSAWSLPDFFAKLLFSFLQSVILLEDVH